MLAEATIAADADSAAVSLRSLRRLSRSGVLAVAAFGAFLAFLDATIVNVVFPDIRLSFPAASIGGLSWVLNAYNIVFAAFLVVAGRVADLLGRRRTFSAGVTLFTLASIVCAAAPSLGVLIAGRLVQAAGAALLVPASLALVVEAFPPERRSHVIGLWGATAAAAAGVGPPLGGALVALWSWRLAFAINLPLGVAAVVATRRVLVESRAPGRRSMPDLRGAGLQAVALALLTLGIVQGGEWGWASPGVIASFAGAAVAAALFGASSRRHPSPVLDPKLLRIRAFAVANAVTILGGAGFYAYLLTNILWLHYIWGWSLLRSGLAVAPAAVVAAVVAGSLGRLADARGHRVLVVPGALVWAGAYVWYATRVGTSPHFLTQWLPGQILSGLGVGATLPLLGSAALAAVPGGRYASASAVASSARQLGGVLGLAVLVAIIGTPTAAASFEHRLRVGWLMSAACFGLVSAGSIWLGRKRAAVAEDDEPAFEPLVEQSAESPLAVVPPRPEPSLLDELPQAARLQLEAAGEPVTLAAGEWLFREGDPADALYLVIAGRLEVLSGDLLLTELGAGAPVGELGLLAGTPRGASVRARRDSRLLQISARSFAELVEANAAFNHVLTARLAAQLQRSRARDATGNPAARVVSVVALGEIPLESVAGLLAETLGRWLTVAAPGRVDAETLDRLEQDHDRVLLVAGGDGDEQWREFCLRQADRVLFVAPSASEPPKLAAQTTCDVLLLGPEPGVERLAAWHDAVEPRRVVSAREAELRAAVEAIGRRIAGKSLGVALAGGGARALAAIGVLSELDRAGYEVDRIAGASVGALVAALHAQGRSPAEIDAACYEEFVRRNPLGDYGVPRHALSRGRRLEAGLVRQFGDVYMEELPRSLAVVSTDLLERDRVVHRRGRLRDALRASIALPGLVPPARLADTLHVDGGLLDNLPVGALEADEGPVLAVNIAAGGSTGRRAGSPRVPALPDILMRSLLIGGAGAHAAAREQAAVIVTPDTRGIGLLEFHQLDRAIEAGRAAGRAAAEALEPFLR